MSFRVFASHKFRAQAKRLTRKYPSLNSELDELSEQLAKNPTLGTPLGHDCYKIRLAVKSKGKGKSGGMRIITWVVFQEYHIVSLLSIYDKSEQDTVSNQELRFRIGLMRVQLGLDNIEN